MRSSSTFRIVLTSLFAALTCVATMFLRIPSPTGGYLNLGDGIVLLSAYLLGPVYGTAAAGLGSMLADLLAGYPMYAAGTLAIKSLCALTAGAAFRALRKRRGDRFARNAAVAGIGGEILMAAGYFAYTAVFLSYGMGATAEIPGNLAQGAAGIAVAAVLTPLLMNTHEIREILDKLNRR